MNYNKVKHPLTKGYNITQETAQAMHDSAKLQHYLDEHECSMTAQSKVCNNPSECILHFNNHFNIRK